ncbi:hypothetical protein IWW50_006303 [Coemansia erecta]|nr:hypothetical protein GGF43_003730 [Coemansia sp. RSA 2618]KAJ2817008.1 hypothetical protein IWW50_006303 [Coemansia erecta]
MLSGLQSQLVQRPRLQLFLREFGLLALAWAVLMVVVVWMALCQEWSDMRWLSKNAHFNRHNIGFWKIKHSQYKMLDDIVLEHLPHVTQRWVTDALVNSAALIMVLGGMLMARGWPARATFLRRIAWMMAILYFLRSITISVTTLPPSVHSCVPMVARNANDWARIVPMMISGQLSGCTDKVFSGHTAVLMISFLFWTRYARHWAFVAYSLVHTVVGIASVLAVRLHYTVDVVIAIMLTYLVHKVYYLLLESAVRQRALKLPHSFLQPGRTGYMLANRRWASGEISEIEEAGTEHVDLDTQSAQKQRVSAEQSMHSVYALDADFDEAKSAAVFPTAIDMDALLLINRPSSPVLPAVVAWMDGLHLR